MRISIPPRFFVVILHFVYSLRRNSPFREYDLPLKRERWHAQRAEEGATCLGGFAYAQYGMYIIIRTSIFGIATLRSR